jgi:8-oxo-dGTP diphosphatase
MNAGAFAVIFDDKRRVLLCHRRDMDAWNLPGGGIETGEAPWDAVVREVREEVGLEAAVVRLTGLYWKPDKDELVFNFECSVSDGAPAASDEADAAQYFALEDLPPNTAPKQVERIRDALATDAVALRVQTGPGIRDLLARRPDA